MSHLGPYEVVEKLGTGGMATVYRARHVETGSEVAIKTVLSDKLSHIESLRREIRILPRLRHAGVIRMIDAGVERTGRPWYAMELLQGQTLSALSGFWRPNGNSGTSPTLTEASVDIDGSLSIATRPSLSAPLPRPRGLEEVLEIAYRLCGPLSYIHGEGIVHRDLKPSNVFVRSDGRPVLIDFGVVEIFEGMSTVARLEADRTRAGTRSYMAPEQLRGELVDARADLYSFGVLLFELIAGELPPPSCDLSLARLVPGIPIEIDVLVTRLLSSERRHRPAHVNDVAEVLAPFVAAAASTERADTLTSGRRTFLHRAETVGRDDVLSDIESHLRRAADGEGLLVIVGGESGIGKSHFAAQVARLARGCNLSVLFGECAPIGDVATSQKQIDIKEAPLHPLRGVLRAFADRCRAAAATDAKSVDRLLGPDIAALVPYEASLGDLCDVGTLTTPDPAATASRQALFRALAHVLLTMSRPEPLLLVIDDLQWADELTLEFLAWLPPELLAESAVFIVGTHRTEETTAAVTALAAKPRCLQITLNHLDDRSIRQMASDMLAMPDLPDAIAQVLVKNSEGNPFFVTEYVRTLVNHEGFERQSEAARSSPSHAAEVPYLPLPRSLFDLLAHQVARLSPSARAIAEAAAVIGRQFDERLLRALTTSGSESLDGLNDLLRLQILEEAAGFQFRFRHDKLREALYAGIATPTRRLLHRQAATALLASNDTQTGAAMSCAQLAYHFQKAGDLDQATVWLEKAADQAFAQFAHHDALRLYRDLLVLDPDVNSAAGSQLRRVRWHRRLSEAHQALGDLGATTEAAGQGLRIAGYQVPTTARGWSLCLLRNVPRQLLHRLVPSRFRRARYGRELQMEAALIVQQLGQRYYFLDAVALIASSLWSVNLAERADGSEQVATPYALLGMVTGICRLQGLSRRYFDLSRAAAQASGDASSLVFAHYTDATVASGLGHWDRAKELLQKAAAQAERSGNESDSQIVQTILANADYFTGRFVDSRDSFLRILELARRHKNPQHLAWGLYGAARAMVPLGQIAEARPMLEEAWSILFTHPDVPSQIICQGLLAGVSRRTGNLELALEHAEATLDRIQKNKLIAYANVTGYAEAIEAFFAAEHGETSAIRRRARVGANRALAQLGRLCWLMPIARAYYLRLRGQRKVTAGRLASARADFETAARLATSLHLPYEQALAWAAVADLVPAADPRCGQAQDKARSLFREMGCAESPSLFAAPVLSPRRQRSAGGWTS